MVWLEDRYRRRFKPQGKGYVLHHRGYDVPFDADEVAYFVADWRRLWLSPWLWGSYLLLGVALPVWLWMQDMRAGAAIVALLAALFLAVILATILRRPNELAEGRLPDDAPEAPDWNGAPPPFLLAIMFGLIFSMTLWEAISRHSLMAGGRACLWAAMLFTFLWPSLAKRLTGTAIGDSNVVGRLVPLCGFAAGAVLMLLDPKRDGHDDWFLGFVAIMLVLFVGSMIWDAFRKSPPAGAA